MSVIVWDGTTLAADSDMNDGQVKLPFTKIWRRGAQLCGVVGPIRDCVKLKEWAEGYEPPGEAPSVSPEAALLIIYSTGEVSRYQGGEYYQHDGKVAIGTGRDFAYGAMYMGASATEAVSAAIKFSVTCSGEVLSLALPDQTERQ